MIKIKLEIEYDPWLISKAQLVNLIFETKGILSVGDTK